MTIGRFEASLQAGSDVCDLRSLTFIDAYGLVGTACAVRCASARTPGLRVRLPPKNTPISQHLGAMGFMDVLAELGLSSPRVSGR